MSDGRFVLGIGRGDSSVGYLGMQPSAPEAFERYLLQVQRYLRGEAVAFADLGFLDERPIADLNLAGSPGTSRLQWLSPGVKVPVDVYATGPKVLEIAARCGDRVTVAVGADPDRVRWAHDVVSAQHRQADPSAGDVGIGACVVVTCHPDRSTALELARGSLGVSARWSVLHGRVAGPVSQEDEIVLHGLHRSYDMRRAYDRSAPHNDELTDAFVERSAAVGSPAQCRARLEELRGLGISRFVIVGASALGEHALESLQLLTDEVLPAFAD